MPATILLLLLSHRATAVGTLIVLSYSQKDSPDKVFFRVINQGALGPVSEISIGQGRKNSLGQEYMALGASSERIWFMDTLKTNAIYEMKLQDAKAP